MDRCVYSVATAATPGAIAIVQLIGPGARDIAARLAGRSVDRIARLVQFDDIDEGLAVAIGDDVVQLMPHGGLRVIGRIAERLTQLGAVHERAPSPRAMYPEATCDFDADLLHTLAIAASPAAIDALLDQRRRWTAALAAGPLDADAIIAASDALDRLVHPPLVVLVGRPNVGKSTLTNLVMGRAASITADLPGTTRDWVGGLAELPTPMGELAVRWFDTPGLRTSDDPIERRAIELAGRLVRSADLLIAMRDPDHDWPDAGATTAGRGQTLRVWNKADAAPVPSGVADVSVSALTGAGLEALASVVADRLGLTVATGGDRPWAFSPALRELASAGDSSRWTRYLGRQPPRCRGV